MPYRRARLDKKKKDTIISSRHAVRPALLASIATLGVLAPLAAAQAQSSDPASEANSTTAKSHKDKTPVIVVTGRGLADGPATPAYDSVVLDRDTITSSSSGRIEDVLSSVAGFQQYRRSDSRATNPSNQGVTLRALGGNASSRSLVLLDGVPVANPFFGYIPLSTLSPDRLSTIRVTRGGGTGAFGAGAVAGTIEMDSAGPDQLGLLNAEALVDNRGETQMDATVSPKLGNSGGYVVASVQWDRGKGFWTTPEDQRVDASARARYESLSGSIRAVAPLTDDIEVQAGVMAFQDHRTFRFQGADSTSSGQQGSIRLVGHGDWKFDVLAYVQAQDYSNIVKSSTSYKETLDQHATPTLAGGGKLEIRPPVGDDHVLRFGTDLRLTGGHLLEFPISTTTGERSAIRHAGGDESDLGLYAQDDWTLGQLVLTAGARADRWTIRNGYYTQDAFDATEDNIDNRYANRSGWVGNFRGGAMWHVAPVIALRGSAYTGMRMPTLNELYRPFVVYPVTTEANADLKVEKLRGYEAGFDVTPATWARLSVTAFYNKLDDAIANVTIATNARKRENVDAIRAKGIEAEAALTFGQVGFNGSLSWTDSKVEASGTQAAIDGLRPAQVPKLMASGTLSWTPRKGWRLAGTVRHIGRQYEDDLNTYILPAATTFDAYLQVPVAGPVSLTVRGENLSNANVVTRNQDGSIDLAEPRTVWVGVKLAM
ncbi:TonB-dependent receptor [Novosphingobium sp. 9]|uniref:TonB-dependent receptor n=1 Tax=Novosphingobium sp. 9 TaxID=2025349 RepID=UPI0021B52DC6|nr:TonB-dependent receptor [Novosphingobium sp. 9]